MGKLTDNMDAAAEGLAVQTMESTIEQFGRKSLRELGEYQMEVVIGTFEAIELITKNEEESVGTKSFMLEQLATSLHHEVCILENILAMQQFEKDGYVAKYDEGNEAADWKGKPALPKPDKLTSHLQSLRERASLCMPVDDDFEEVMQSIRIDAMEIYRKAPGLITRGDLKLFRILIPKAKEVSNG